MDADIDIENEINKIRWERWRAKQDKEREKTYCYWGEWKNWNNWQDCPVEGECHSVSGAYIDFCIYCKRSGQSDCEGGTGSWRDISNAPCQYNAIMRFARAGESSGFYDVLSKCYWQEHSGCGEHCYMEDYGWNKPIYHATVVNNSLTPSFGHSICAEHLGGDMTEFNNWKFFQYDNLNIQPPDPGQMPCGTPTENTKVKIKEITSIGSCGGSVLGDLKVIFEIDVNCIVACVYP